MIRGITLRDPWSRCVAAGEKLVENRARRTSFRSEIAIHSGQKVDWAADMDPRVLGVLGPNPRDGAHLGCILAVADLVGCHPADLTEAGRTCCAPWGDRTYLGKTAFHLVLDNVRALAEPVPCSGALQVGWVVLADVEEQVRAQLVGAVT